jgi:GDPmannose 4,6-dehydratase
MLQQDEAEDFVVATGVTTEIRDIVRLTFEYLGVTLNFSGTEEDETGNIESIDESRLNELGIDPANLSVGKTIVSVDPRYYRPTEVELLIGDPSKANKKLNWKPKYDLQALVEDMVQSDLATMQKKSKRQSNS